MPWRLPVQMLSLLKALKRPYRPHLEIMQHKGVCRITCALNKKNKEYWHCQ